jgi:hypothetical protein
MNNKIRLFSGFSFLTAVLITGIVALSCLNPIGYNPLEVGGKIIVGGEITVDINATDSGILVVRNITRSKNLVKVTFEQGGGGVLITLT